MSWSEIPFFENGTQWYTITFNKACFAQDVEPMLFQGLYQIKLELFFNVITQDNCKQGFTYILTSLEARSFRQFVVPTTFL